MARPQSPAVRAAKRRRHIATVDATAPLGTDVSFTVPEVAAMFKCGDRKVWQLVSDGKLQIFYVGTLVRISRDSLEAFMANGGAPNAAKADKAS